MQVDDLNDVQDVETMKEDPILSLTNNNKSTDVLFINTMKNILEENHLKIDRLNSITHSKGLFRNHSVESMDDQGY